MGEDDILPPSLVVVKQKKETPADKFADKILQALKNALNKLGIKLSAETLSEVRTFASLANSKQLSKDSYRFFTLEKPKFLVPLLKEFQNELRKMNINSAFLSLIKPEVKPVTYKNNRGRQVTEMAFVFTYKFEPIAAKAKGPGLKKLPSTQGMKDISRIMKVAIDAGAQAAGIDIRSESWEKESENYLRLFKGFVKASKDKDLYGGGNLDFMKGDNKGQVSKFLKAFVEKIKEAGIRVKDESRKEHVVLRILLNTGKGEEKDNPVITVARNFPWFIARLVLPRRSKTDAG